MTTGLMTETAPADQMAEVDSRIQWQLSQLGVGATFKVEGRYPSDAPSYSVVTGCEISGSLTQREAAANIVLREMEPAAQVDIEGWLAELSVMVIRRQGDEFGDELRLEVYSKNLRAYPADVAWGALLGRTWKFWPAWEELKAECEKRVRKRRHLLRALQRPPETQALPEPRESVDADRVTEILNQAGFTPKRFEAVRNAPMARSEAELFDAKRRVPHWSETADADDLRFAEIKAIHAAEREKTLAMMAQKSRGEGK